MKDFHELARQIEVIEMANPNRTVARVGEAASRAARLRSDEERRIRERIAAGKAVRGKIDLTKDFGVFLWGAERITPSDDAAWDQALKRVGTSMQDWMAKVNHYYRGFSLEQEKERKVFGRSMEAYMKASRTQVLAPHARKIADAYMQSCIQRGIEWKLVADPYYGLKDIYGNGNSDDASALTMAVRNHLRANHPKFGQEKKPISDAAYHKLGVNIVRWVIENPT